MRLEFNDVERPEVARQFADTLRAVEERHLFLPAVLIDGALAPIEWFSAWGLVDLVEERFSALSVARAAVST